MNKGKSNYYN